MNYYFEREVKHLEYIEQRKKIRDQEKKEMELELEKKKTVSDFFQKQKSLPSSDSSGNMHSFNRKIMPFHILLLFLWQSRGYFSHFLAYREQQLSIGP